jgi:hypothetical protein
VAKTAPLSIDAERRVKVLYHEEGGKTFVETRQDAEPLIEAAKILADVPPSKEDGWRFIGFIPDAVWQQAVTEGWMHDKARWRKWLSDRDNRAFNGGRVNPF